MLKTAKKYLLTQVVSTPWSPILLCDPTLGPYAAAGMLKAFHENNWINSQFYEKSKAEFDRVFASVDSPNDTRNNGEAIDEYIYNIESSVYAWPGKTYAQSRQDMKINWQIQKDNTTNVKGENITALRDAYGLCHDDVISELLSIAANNLMDKQYRPDVEPLKSRWTVDMGVKEIYEDFESMCPMIADMFNMHFASVPICTTFVEQVFTTCNFVSHANMANSTLNRNLKTSLNVRSDFCRKMESFKELSKCDGIEPPDEIDDDNHEYESDDESPLAQKRRKKYRELRQTGSLYMFFKHAEDMVEEIQTHYETDNNRLPTRDKISHKRKREDLLKQPLIQRELDANIDKRKDKDRCVLSTVTDRSKLYDQAVACKSDALAVPVKDKFLEAARSNKWVKSGKIKYLKNFYKDSDGLLVETEENMQNANVKPKEDATEEKKSICCMFLDCWQKNNVSENDLDNIILKYKE